MTLQDQLVQELKVHRRLKKNFAFPLYDYTKNQIPISLIGYTLRNPISHNILRCETKRSLSDTVFSFGALLYYIHVAAGLSHKSTISAALHDILLPMHNNNNNNNDSNDNNNNKNVMYYTIIIHSKGRGESRHGICGSRRLGSSSSLTGANGGVRTISSTTR